ncbi:hypothetical protein [aff. Roholtiella sp. LEGE 12411]|uniref:hypothetical protein n=1 Tax=aff. Roholtiella sp. LEGE 12411 TaxID=1828822 RepID=UPI001882F8CA|nr:hypothetical protein [aff. Roholtiella sp. LEGE 12411]MBE9033606.1 hypothetical protein [aff. Roholtiella sp. LEGE 12411]
MSFTKIYVFFGGSSDRETKMIPLKQTLSTLLLVTVLLMVAMGFASPASAELYSRANGTMVYDSDLYITWLADANYAATLYEQSCGKLGHNGGFMDFPEAMQFVDELVYGGFSDWRLPNAVQPDLSCKRQTVVGSHGFNCTNSEMGHLFYVDLGAKAGENIIQNHNENYNLFRNISRRGLYWNTPDYPTFAFISRIFQTRNGKSNAYSKSRLVSVWPVRVGDVGLDAKGEGIRKNWKCKDLNTQQVEPNFE